MVSCKGLVLGQCQGKDTSNEITTLSPRLCLLELLAGCVVTTDAIDCQTEIVETIVHQNADYLIAVKENQGQLDQDVQDLFAGCRAVHFRDVPHDYHKTVNQGHGRIEIRECWTLSDLEFLDYLRQRGMWKNLHPLVVVRAEFPKRD